MLRSGMYIGDRYEILEKVGSGGMSDVYKAKCHKLNRNVAIKVLKAEYSEDKNFVAKFKTEAQSAACLSHPNIVSVYDVGEDNGLHYIVMELIEGITLKKYIKRKGKLSVKEATSIAIQVAQGIECAHNNHIIHRDIKPQNIIISKEGKVKVADFGIARAASANTINSNAMGSVHYISPEQARGGYIDEKSDIYSLGITIFEMLTGHVPFEGDTTVTIALQHIQNEMPDIREYVPDIPISTEKIVYKCTQKKPDRRYLRISALITDLKKSLIYPNEDFVILAPTLAASGETVMFDPEEVKAGVAAATKEELAAENTEESPGDLDDDDSIDRINPTLERILHIGVIVAGILFIIVLIMLAIRFFGTSGGTSENGTTKETTTAQLADGYVYMPQLMGYTSEEAEAIMKSANLGIQYKYENDDNYDKGEVCKQSISEGRVIAQHTRVTVTISNGANTFSLGTYKDKSLEAAKETLEKLKLTVKVKYEFNSETATNSIISTDPKTGTNMKVGDTVTLTVSRGVKYTLTGTVPDVVGQTVDTASTTLGNASLGLGTTSYEASDKVEKNTIISQAITKNSKVPVYTNIDIVVSSGPSKGTVPDFGTGRTTEEDAREKLENENLALGAVNAEYSKEPMGTIIDQSIEGGKVVDAGTAVDVVISMGEEPTTTEETTTEETTTEETTTEKEKETTTEEETTTKEEDSSTTQEEEETTTARRYSGTFSINKGDLDQGGTLTSGKVTITVAGKTIGLSNGYEDLSTWPSDDFVQTVERESGGTVTITAQVEGSSQKWTYELTLQ